MARIGRWTKAALAAAAALGLTAGRLPPHEDYARTGATCGGYPRAQIGLAPGMCAGLVVAPEPGRFADRRIRMPRGLVALDGSGRDWLVADLGAWVPGRGAVWRMRLDGRGGAAVTPVLTRLDMPHTVAIGPDGAAYVGEMGAILRFDPRAPDAQATVRRVVEGLPDNRLHPDRHPLPAFLFMPDGAMMVDVGANTDDCSAPADRGPDGRCLALQGPAPQAALRRYAYLGGGRWDARFTTVATGLRNSVALALTPDGRVLQGENSYDFKDHELPHDEINLVRDGGFYGWPYCYDVDKVMPAYASRPPVDCRGPAVTRPVLLLPPHTAPLAMRYYRGAMFPQLSGKLLVTWHGYEPAAGRLAAYDVDGHGLPRTTPRAAYDVYTPGGGATRRPFGEGPSATATVLTPGWDRRPGQRPMGGPVDLAVAPDGAIWVTDDRNGTVIRLAADRPA